eukprot:EG_transcript_28722
MGSRYDASREGLVRGLGTLDPECRAMGKRGTTTKEPKGRCLGQNQTANCKYKREWEGVQCRGHRGNRSPREVVGGRPCPTAPTDGGHGGGGKHTWRVDFSQVCKRLHRTATGGKAWGKLGSNEIGRVIHEDAPREV